jgi:hypothetical protein
MRCEILLAVRCLTSWARENRERRSSPALSILTLTPIHPPVPPLAPSAAFRAPHMVPSVSGLKTAYRLKMKKPFFCRKKRHERTVLRNLNNLDRQVKAGYWG